MQKKIIICSPSQNNPVGGVERFCYLLKDVLIKNGFEVEILGREDLEKYLLWKIFKKIKGLDLIILGFLLGRLADKYKPDLVVTNGLYGFSTKSLSINIQHGTFAKAADKIDKNIFKKIIRKYLWGFFEKLAVKKAIKVVAVSYNTKIAVNLYYKRNDVDIILNAVDTNIFSPRDKIEARKIFNLPQDKKLILFVGRLTYEKSPEILYDLAKKFESEDIYFVFATDKIPNWFLKKTIFFLNVNYQQLPFLYSACDVFILPSKHEGFAFTLVEAMACGLPFVISNVGGAYEISQKTPMLAKFIIDEKNLNPNTFYVKIKEFLNLSPETLQEIKELEKNFVLENCSLEIFEKKYLDLIKQILKQ